MDYLRQNQEEVLSELHLELYRETGDSHRGESSSTEDDRGGQSFSIRSRRTLVPGQIVLKAQPYAKMSLVSTWQSHCVYCHEAGASLQRCAKCKEVYYCG